MTTAQCRCGATEGLFRRGSHLRCLTCHPQICRDCGRAAPQVRFASPAGRFCVECRRQHANHRDKLRREGVPSGHAKPFGFSPRHLAWIRRQACAVASHDCRGNIQAHHVRTGQTAGVGMRPPDRWAVPLCPGHHTRGHVGGWTSFAHDFGVDLSALARSYADRSPYRAEICEDSR